MLDWSPSVQLNYTQAVNCLIGGMGGMEWTVYWIVNMVMMVNRIMDMDLWM